MTSSHRGSEKKLNMGQGPWGFGERTDLQALPGIDNIRSDDIVIFKLKGDDPSFH